MLNELAEALRRWTEKKFARALGAEFKQPTEVAKVM